MAFWDFLGGSTISAAERLIGTVGNGVGSALDRMGYTRKLPEGEKWDKILASMEIEGKDADTARSMFITEMSTQKLPWFVRLINGLFRPLCGYAAMAYLTESIWAQVLVRFNWNWVPTVHDPVVDVCMLSIIGFFFGLRQRSKERAVTTIS